MLKESHVEKLKTLPKDAIKFKVGYHGIFAPSESLFSYFNELRLKLMQKGKTEAEARKKAWEQTYFKKRYRKKSVSTLKLVDKLKEIKNLSEKKDVYICCYCGKSLCSRFILVSIINKM